MSPLARYVAGLSVTSRQWWVGNGYDKTLAPFPKDVKCFELSEVSEVLDTLTMQAQQSGNIAEARSFLPAPVTWIEHRGVSEGRPMVSAYLLVQDADGTAASCVSIIGIDTPHGTAVAPIPLAPLPLLGASDPDGWAIESTLSQQTLYTSHPFKTAMDGSALPKKKNTAVVVSYDGSNADWDEVLRLEQTRSYWLYSALSLINSPRIVNRTEHKAPSKLRKILTRRDHKPFQLLPWHEIRLDVATDDGEGGERVTGPKALHFCRQYIRIRMGRLERVRAHWRGDASLGVSQASYKVMS